MLMVVASSPPPLVLVPGVEGQVQAHPVPVGETVAVALGVGLHVEAERCVVREGAPQVANREDRAEAPQPGPGGGGFVHMTSIPFLLLTDLLLTGGYQPTATIMYWGLATEMSDDWFASSS